MVFASVRVDNNVVTIDMSVVCEIPDVFPENICDLPLECKVKFAIDLVPDTKPGSMAPYWISASQLGEPKSQLEDLLEKKFVKPSVSL